MSDMLLNPMNNGQPTVQPLPKLPGSTPPFPITLRTIPEYFQCSQLNHHMHRTDGKRLGFLFGVLETRDEFDIQYIENEIAGGNPYVRKATNQEVDVYLMRKDPKGTMEKKLTPEIEERVRAELEVELRKSLELRLSTLSTSLTSEQQQELLSSLHLGKQAGDVAYAQGDLLDRDSNLIAGTTALDKLKAQFGGSMKSGTGTVVLGGISGTDKMANAASSTSK